MEEMKTISVKCPKCNNTIGIRNHSGSDTILIKCPICHEDLTIKLKPHPIKLGDISHAHAPVNPRPQPVKNNDETIGVWDLPKGNPLLMMYGQKYPLRAGFNTVGRKSAMSTATLQLPVEDQHMSRTNAMVNVSRGASGGWHVTINSCNERNLVKINNRQLAMGDKAILQPGDVIMMGQTKVVFVYE